VTTAHSTVWIADAKHAEIAAKAVPALVPRSPIRQL
jgi:hypothetical protein